MEISAAWKPTIVVSKQLQKEIYNGWGPLEDHSSPWAFEKSFETFFLERIESRFLYLSPHSLISISSNIIRT
jgi:hypothetical protein